jgi:hypothetical protein
MARKLNIVVIPLEDRFWAKVAKTDDPNECWLWRAHISPNGYGSIFHGVNRKPRMLQAHIASYLLNNGGIPTGYDVMHSCDVRHCVNPNHLSVGTRKDNMEDAAKKNRLRHGENHYNTKITDEQVKEIRNMPIYHGCMTKYARIYNVSKEQIRDIIRNKRRVNVK